MISLQSERRPTPPPRSLRSLGIWSGLLGASSLAFSVLTTVPALAQTKTLSGTWSASAMRAVWSVGDWGASCGPRPSGAGAGGGTVTVRQNGGELTFSGAGGGYTTSRCWEQYPGLGIVSHSGGQRGWRTTCRTTPGDPRQATVTTTLSATDDVINFDEIGQYQFVLEGQNCTASVRRSRFFKLIQREGESAAPSPSPTELPTPAPAPSPETRPDPAPARKTTEETPRPEESPTPPNGLCNPPGPAARLEIRPSRKLMRPGEEFKFVASVRDANGCAVSLPVVWRLESGTAALEVTGAGRVKVKADAVESEGVLSGAVTGHAARVSIEIASEAGYLATLASKGLNAQGESEEAAVALIATGSIGAGKATSEDNGNARRTIFLAVLGMASVGLGMIGLLLALRGRKRPPHATPRGLVLKHVPAPPRAMVCPTCRNEFPPDGQFCPNDGNRLIAVEDRASQGPSGGICPVCGQGFDPGTLICPKDGEELLPAPVALAPSNEEALPPANEWVHPARLICPVCGTRYPGDARFCGSDGAQLVAVN